MTTTNTSNTTYAVVVWDDGKFSDRKLTVDEITELCQQKSARLWYAHYLQTSFELICEGTLCEHAFVPSTANRPSIVFYSKPNIEGRLTSMLPRTDYGWLRLAPVALNLTTGEFNYLKKLYKLAPNNEDLRKVIDCVTQSGIDVYSSNPRAVRERALALLRKFDAKQAATVNEVNSAVAALQEKYQFAFTKPRSKLSAAEIRNIAAMLDCA